MSQKDVREKIVSGLDGKNDLVGFDLDGTLNDLASYQFLHAKNFFRKDPINPEAYDIEDMYQCSHFIRQMFWLRYIWKYSLKYPAREDASLILKKIQELGLSPCMITARVFVTRDDLWGALFREMVEIWKKEENIPIDKSHTIFCSEKYSAIEKANFCKRLNIRWMFEDKPDNVLMISQIAKTHVLCPRAPYNKMIKCGKNITVINSLTEGLEIIEEELKESGGYQYVK